MAYLPPSSTNLAHASLFGPMEPAGNCPFRIRGRNPEGEPEVAEVIGGTTAVVIITGGGYPRSPRSRNHNSLPEKS